MRMPPSWAARCAPVRQAGLHNVVLYAVMFVITFAVHVPLNDELQQAGDPARIEDLAAVRDDYVTTWIAWDIVRTLVSIAAFGCLTWALTRSSRRGRG